MENGKAKERWQNNAENRNIEISHVVETQVTRTTILARTVLARTTMLTILTRKITATKTHIAIEVAIAWV